MEIAVASTSVLSLASPLRHAASLMPFHRAAFRLPPPTQDRSGCKYEMVPGIRHGTNGRGQNKITRDTASRDFALLMELGLADRQGRGRSTSCILITKAS